MRSVLALLGAAGLLVGQTGSARASVTFANSGTNAATGDWLSAAATFDLVNHGTQLQITLANLGGGVRDASDVLTAVFFNLDGVSTLTPVSAVLGSGSVLLNGPLPANQTLGDNWEYLGNLSGIPGQATRGISATGLGVFGHGNFGSKSQNLHGADYGIVNGPVTTGSGQLNNLQLESNTVVFTLAGLPANFSLSAVNDVEFQYGTSLAPSETMLIAYPVPEPGTGALFLLSSAVLLWVRRPRH